MGLSHSFAVTETNQVYCWVQHDSHMQPQKVDKVEGNIVDIKSSNNQTIFMTEEQIVYKIEHANGQVKNLKAEPIKKLKNIVQIASSPLHFMMLQREDIKPLEEWDHL